jgi:hypothetical protein
MINDIMIIRNHLSFCLLLSFILALYEGYDCTFLKPLPAKIRQFPPTIALSSNININSNISNNDQNNIDFKASMPSSGIQQVIIKVSLLTAYQGELAHRLLFLFSSVCAKK